MKVKIDASKPNFMHYFSKWGGGGVLSYGFSDSLNSTGGMNPIFAKGVPSFVVLGRDVTEGHNMWSTSLSYACTETSAFALFLHSFLQVFSLICHLSVSKLNWLKLLGPQLTIVFIID